MMAQPQKTHKYVRVLHVNTSTLKLYSGQTRDLRIDVTALISLLLLFLQRMRFQVVIVADAGSSKAYAIFNYEESLLRNKPWAIGKNSDE